MTSTMASAASLRAREHALRCAGALRGTGSNRLPPIRSLAQQANVSSVTMWRAVGALVEEGMLETRLGSGVFVAGGVSSDTTTTEPLHLRVASRIRSDIAAGQYRFDPVLPLYKELCARYGVVNRTLHRALSVLEHDGVVVPHGRRYRVARTAYGSRDTVVLVGRGTPYGEIVLPTPRMVQQLHVLNAECARRGVALATAGAQYEGDSLRFLPEQEALLEGRGGGSSVLGYIIWGASLRGSAIASLVNRLSSQGKPLSFLDEGGGTHMQRADLYRPGVRAFTTSWSPTSGHVVGLYLRSLGHRRAAYFGTGPGVVWSENRYAGLRETFCAGDPSATVFRYRPPSNPLPSPDPPETLVARALSTYQTRDPELTGEFEGRVARALATMVFEVQTRMASQERQERAVPLFEEAMRQSDATVWIAGNDEIALRALRFLQEHRVRVPHDISVVGFDDTPEAFAQGLTSYSFDLPAIAHATLHHVLSPQRRLRTAKRAEEMRGFVSERLSTRRV